MKLLRIPFLGIVFLCLATSSFAQAPPYGGGSFGLGLRNAANIFGHNGMVGLGAGGHFKLGVGSRVNTEWFLDYITSAGEQSSYRHDYHIGWAVQFALLKKGFGEAGISPYIMGGQCFDLTRVGIRVVDESPLVFSAAAQAGAGISTFVHPRLELNLQAQYMMHLTKNVEAHFHSPGDSEVQVGNASFKGHTLLTGTLTFYFLRFWKG